MNKITDELLNLISDFKIDFKGAYNIREDGACAARQSTENIKLETMDDGKGLLIKVAPNTKGETVYIPACVTKGGVDDLVYNDFYIGEGADVVIVAGCGVHTDDHGEAKHNGVHRFFIEKGAKVMYQEKHIGTGKGDGGKRINPVTEVTLAEDASLEMNTVQLGGVDSTKRMTKAVLDKNAKLVVSEKLMTDYEEYAETEFEVTLLGECSGADLVSRSVAKGNSKQVFKSIIKGLTKCTGHSECDAILADNATVIATPSLEASNIDAELIHEAAIGKIAGEQILKLKTLGMTDEEAENKIIEGFLA